MSRVFWDTNLFIYLIESKGERGDRVAHLAERMLQRGDQLYTSVLTLGELLVKPIEKRDIKLREAYEGLLAANSVLIPFDKAAATIYADIRHERTRDPLGRTGAEQRGPHRQLARSFLACCWRSRNSAIPLMDLRGFSR